MVIKKFTTIDNQTLLIKRMKLFLIFELMEQSDKINFSFRFDKEIFKELVKYIEDAANEIWDDFIPKEATSLRTDYSEYYDRKLDNNGYLDIVKNGFDIERPTLESLKLYQFNKGRLESFIYDLKKYTLYN